MSALNFGKSRAAQINSLIASTELDGMQPAARGMELHTGDNGIKTMKIDRPSVCRIIHRVACYVLEVGAVAPAPADKADGIHREETDKAENSMGGAI